MLQQHGWLAVLLCCDITACPGVVTALLVLPSSCHQQAAARDHTSGNYCDKRDQASLPLFDSKGSATPCNQHSTCGHAWPYPVWLHMCGTFSSCSYILPGTMTQALPTASPGPYACGDACSQLLFDRHTFGGCRNAPLSQGIDAAHRQIAMLAYILIDHSNSGQGYSENAFLN